MKHINEILKECLNTMEKNMSHTVPHKALYKNQGVIMPSETPSARYTIKCMGCGDDVLTNYRQTKYCHKPCVAPTKKQPSKRRAPPLTKAQIESSSKLSRKWLSRRL